MVQIRIARAEDASIIAQIHAKNWQQHYRGILSDDYLDNQAEEERVEVWTKRFSEKRSNQHTLLAEVNGETIGFACVIGNEDPKWGSLLDNLHVSTQAQGQGIGTILLKAAAKWSFEHFPNNSFYLLVYEQNQKALQFYRNLGGTPSEKIVLRNPDGSEAITIRVVWQSKAEMGYSEYNE